MGTYEFSVPKESVEIDARVWDVMDEEMLKTIEAGVEILYEDQVQHKREVPEGVEWKVFNFRGITGTMRIEVKRLDALSLMYDMKITNNWLKMHGGIMVRRGGKRKEKRIF